MEILEGYVGEEWVVDLPTSLLREMVRYVEFWAESDGAAADAAEDEVMAGSGDEGSLIDEGMGW